MPPITAAIRPAMGGIPEAIEMANDSGTAIKKRIKPETMSVLQFSFSPASPSFGTTSGSLLLGMVLGS
jgi:hypothetical protein